MYYTTFGWRNGKYPPDYDLSPHNGLTAARRAILREFLPRREHGELLKRFLPILEKAFVGASVEEAVAPSQRYAVALHLRTFDFIEGKNATDAAAFDWLQTRKARFKWTCLSKAPASSGVGLFTQSKGVPSGGLAMSLVKTRRARYRAIEPFRASRRSTSTASSRPNTTSGSPRHHI